MDVIELMSRKKIFSVGLDLPSEDFEYIALDSDRTLLDADIVVFSPGLSNYTSHEGYNGKPLLSQHASFNVVEKVEHWRSEISAAVSAGKLAVVFLNKPHECYRHTGRKEHSGTGRSRVTTNIVKEVSSYEMLPMITSATPKSGTKVKLEAAGGLLASYWAEFGAVSPYEVAISGSFTQVLLRSVAGDRVVGAANLSERGALVLIPPVSWDEEKFVEEDEESGEFYWTEEALQFGKRLASALVAIASTARLGSQSTPPPDWVTNDSYRIATESNIEAELEKLAAEAAKLQKKRGELEGSLAEAGSLRRLLYEQGHPLEEATLEALRLFGFDAEPFEDAESEFDAVFSSPEGRCLGEAEGKDTKAINIAKFSQLERNLQEDFARDGVEEFAKGVLFGNAFRLSPVTERGEYFTAKCVSAAQRSGIALVCTPDLFAPAAYLKEHPRSKRYAAQCRKAIFGAHGSVVKFPAPPEAQGK